MNVIVAEAAVHSEAAMHGYDLSGRRVLACRPPRIPGVADSSRGGWDGRRGGCGDLDAR
jgi:hypothetical protein